jgi:PleD family two-component response regulator
MMATRAEEDGPRLLSQETFAFELDAELRRAVRSRSDVTLVVLEAGRETDASGTMADETAMLEIAEIIGDAVRDTDLVGFADRFSLGLVLVDANYHRSAQVLERVMVRIGQRAFAPALRLAVGVASYPEHGVDAGSLKKEAKSRPFLRETFGTDAAVSRPPRRRVQFHRKADRRADPNRSGTLAS